jgi:hypothetical protein
MGSRVVKIIGFHTKDCFYGSQYLIGKIGVYTPNDRQPISGFCNGHFQCFDEGNVVKYYYFFAALLEDVNVCK